MTSIFMKYETTATILAGLLLIAVPAFAQTPQQPPAQTQPARPAQSARPAEKPEVAALEARIVELEENLKRQTVMAENARSEVARLREEATLRQELIALGVQRNAELYAIATEVVEKGLSHRDFEPFIQQQRVHMENLRQSYEDRLRAARMYESTLPPSVEQRMQQDLAKPKEDAGS